MELSHRAAALARARPSAFASALARAFSTARTLNQDQPQSPAPSPRQPQPAAAAAAAASSSSRAPGAALVDFDLDIDRSLDFLSDNPSVSRSRTSRFASPAAQQKNRVQQRQQPASSINDLLNDIANSPRSKHSVRDSLGGLSPRVADSPVVPLGVVPSPTLGRTVDVVGSDVARAFRSLDVQIARNKVKHDMFRQRFHERPGLKRKRLASERWRRRFKEAFKGTVKMVNNMRKQGW